MRESILRKNIWDLLNKEEIEKLKDLTNLFIDYEKSRFYDINVKNI